MHKFKIICALAEVAWAWKQLVGWLGTLWYSGFVVEFLKADKSIQLADSGEGLWKVKKIILSITE